MNFIKRNLLLSLAVFSLYSCGSDSSKEKSSEAGASNYKLAIVDSVQVDILASGFSVVDVHPETGDLLVIQSNPPRLWIISQEGEIKTTWEKNGNGPDEIGSYLLSAEFFGEGVAMMGYMQLKRHLISIGMPKETVDSAPGNQAAIPGLLSSTAALRKAYAASQV